MKLIKTSALALLMSFMFFACSEKEIDDLNVRAVDTSNSHETTDMDEDDCPGFGYWFMKKGNWASKGYSGRTIMVNGMTYTEAQMMSMYMSQVKKRGMSGLTMEQKEFYRMAAMMLSKAAGYDCDDMDDDDDDMNGGGNNGGGNNGGGNNGGGNNGGGNNGGGNNGGGNNGGGNNGGGNNGK
ncbi:hypothetical protein [Rufibacter tibetensis]|uniref:Lipoprotein n=1 Tax=Rufibacter tibetensis TaxID=512763 RepID=A0A0P0CZJ9_9BACT|nr:hypothetical protein [Rufibacter tibetensis]ALJ00192.1 hypothetical protein DC20_16000 [Rufibacter tibetensis]